MRQRKGLMKPQRSSADFKRRRKNFMRLELRFTPKPEWSNISHLVSTITEIQEAIEKLPASDKSALAAWLQSKEEPIMSEPEQAALLARLDKASAELDAGKGVPLARVRKKIRGRAGK
jgi:hypothetical protein